jgi:ankyrin repeat protein
LTSKQPEPQLFLRHLLAVQLLPIATPFAPLCLINLSKSNSGNLALVKWLLAEGGSKITEHALNGNSALLMASKKGHLALTQWLLEEGGSDITETNTAGETVWDRLKLEGADPAALTFLLQAMSLLGKARPNLW